MNIGIPIIGVPLYIFVFDGVFPPAISPRCYDVDKEKDWLKSGDVIVSVPMKSGTTFMLQLVQSIRTHGGYADYDDLILETPWMEQRHFPGESWKEHLHYVKTFSHGFNDTFYKYRVFKAHQAVPVIKFRDDVKYIVILRKPIEMISSMIKFASALNPKMAKFWSMPLMKADTESDLFWVEMTGGVIDKFICDFVNGWWPLFKKPNVLAYHYSTLMKMDRAEVVKIVANFLGESLTVDETLLVIEQSSLDWMKRNEEKYIMAKFWDPFRKNGLVPSDLESTLLLGDMIGKGGLEKTNEIKLKFPDLEQRLNKRVQSCIKDKDALRWLYNNEI